MEFNEDAVGVGHYLLLPSQLLGSSWAMALALPLLIVLESGLKVPIVLWCSPCQGHETSHPCRLQATPSGAVSGLWVIWYERLVPPELGCGGQHPGLVASCPSHPLPKVTLLGLRPSKLLGASPDRTPSGSSVLPPLHRLLW